MTAAREDTMRSIRSEAVLSLALVLAALGAVAVGSPAADPASPAPARGPAAPAVLTDPITVYTVPQVSKPAYLAPFNDPTFGSQVKRVGNNVGASTSPVSGSWGSDARHVYSKQQPWSSDGSLMVIENRSGGSPSVLILDGNTYAPKYAPCSNYDLYDYRWNPSKAHPHEQVNVNGSGNELCWFDVTTCTKTRSWTLPLTADYGIGSGEGNPSADGRYIAVGNATQAVVVDMESWPTKKIGPVYTFPPCSLDTAHPTSNCGVDWISISPSGKFLVVLYDGTSSAGYGPMRVFDIDPTTLAVTGPHRMAQSSPRCPNRPNGWILSWNHADMTLDEAGDDIIVGDPECGTTMGHPTKVRLRDGAMTQLTTESNEASVYHTSCRNADRPGWAYFSFWKEPGMRFSDEIVAVKLDGSGTVERLAHMHSASDGCYRCEAHPVPSPDGKRVLFASNWAQDCGSGCGSASDIKDYVVADGAVGTTGVEESGAPPAGPPRVALEAIRPNPTATVPTIVYSLDGWDPARLELLDVAGRVVMRQELGSPGPGRHEARLGLRRSPTPGVYWVRLTQDTSSAASTVIFMH